MTVGYIPVSQRSSRRSNSTDRDLESNCSEPQKPFRMSVGQRQLVGMMVFFWFVCLWVGLKIMEAAQYSHRSPLLPTTNALLDTPDLYHSLTVPLLNLVNRTQLISTRCGTTTLEPHLLSFLTNDLAGSPSISTSTSTTTTSSSNDGTVVDTTTTATEQSMTGEVAKRTRPYRYLFAIVLQDSEKILSDVLTRTLETISILGPDNCHLSVVDHASTDATKEMLHMLKEFLDMYNRGDIQLLGSPTSSSVEKRADGVDAKVERGVRGGQDKKSKGKGKDKKKRRSQYMSYTITTMTARDTSVENLAHIKDLALDPLLAAASTSTNVVTTDGSGGSADDVTFDRIVLMDPVVTCAEDLLELIFQSLLQDAEVTCGMDFGYHSSANVGGAAVAGSAEEGYTVANPGKVQDGVYDSTVTRDMLHQQLHRDTSTNNQISNDATTQTRFAKRVPFQVESCWSRAVVLKTAAALGVSGVASGKPFLFSEVIEKQTRLEVVETGVVEGQCATAHALKDDRALFCNALWGTVNPVLPTGSLVPDTTPPSPPPSTNDVIRMVLVPTIQFTDSPKDYVLQGKFNGWGVWPKTEKQYRDEQENRLVAVSHRPSYGYRPSTSSYGYTPRAQEEAEGEDSASGLSSFLEVVFSGQRDKEGKDEGESEGQEQELEEKEKEEKEMRRQEEERIISAIVPEETLEGLKARLETVGAVFGVQDIQNAVFAKHDSDLIPEWRPRFVVADDALPGSIDC